MRYRGIAVLLALTIVTVGCSSSLGRFAADDLAQAVAYGKAAQAAGLLTPGDAYVGCAAHLRDQGAKLASVYTEDPKGPAALAMRLHIDIEQVRSISPECAKVMIEIQRRAGAAIIPGLGALR
mgnify:CR=1 FL=1